MTAALVSKIHTALYKRGCGGDYIKAHRVGITLKDLTGLQFFTKLPDRKQRQMHANCVDPKFH